MTHTFNIVRPLIFQEYDRTESVIECEQPVILTTDQVTKLFQQFQHFASAITNGEIEDFSENVKIVIAEVTFDPKFETVTVKIRSETQLPEKTIEDIQTEFDAWFVDDAAPTWTFDIIPHKKWMMIGYRD